MQLFLSSKKVLFLLSWCQERGHIDLPPLIPFIQLLQQEGRLLLVLLIYYNVTSIPHCVIDLVGDLNDRSPAAMRRQDHVKCSKPLIKELN